MKPHASTIVYRNQKHSQKLQICGPASAHTLLPLNTFSPSPVSNKLPPYGSSSLTSRHSSHLQRIKGVWRWWVAGYCVCYGCLCVCVLGGWFQSLVGVQRPGQLVSIETLTWLTDILVDLSCSDLVLGSSCHRQLLHLGRRTLVYMHSNNLFRTRLGQYVSLFFCNFIQVFLLVIRCFKLYFPYDTSHAVVSPHMKEHVPQRSLSEPNAIIGAGDQQRNNFITGESKTSFITYVIFLWYGVFITGRCTVMLHIVKARTLCLIQKCLML